MAHTRKASSSSRATTLVEESRWLTSPNLPHLCRHLERENRGWDLTSDPIPDDNLLAGLKRGDHFAFAAEVAVPDIVWVLSCGIKDCKVTAQPFILDSSIWVSRVKYGRDKIKRMESRPRDSCHWNGSERDTHRRQIKGARSFLPWMEDITTFQGRWRDYSRSAIYEPSDPLSDQSEETDRDDVQTTKAKQDAEEDHWIAGADALLTSLMQLVSRDALSRHDNKVMQLDGRMRELTLRGAQVESLERLNTDVPQSVVQDARHIWNTQETSGNSLPRTGSGPLDPRAAVCKDCLSSSSKDRRARRSQA